MEKKQRTERSVVSTPNVSDRAWICVFQFLDAEDHGVALRTNSQLQRAGKVRESWAPKLQFESSAAIAGAFQAGCTRVVDLTLVQSDQFIVDIGVIHALPSDWLPRIQSFRLLIGGGGPMHWWGSNLRNRWMQMPSLTDLELQQAMWCWEDFTDIPKTLRRLSLVDREWSNGQLLAIKNTNLTDLTLRESKPDRLNDTDGFWELISYNKHLKRLHCESFRFTSDHPFLHLGWHEKPFQIEVLRLPGCSTDSREFIQLLGLSLPLMPKLQELELPEFTRDEGLTQRPFWLS